jgi:hypothetical protein
MSDRILSLGSDDDLPRSFRREREARERASRAPQHQTWPDTPQPAVVTALKIPFFRLMFFFLKAVIAAIPALILLTFLLYAGGQLLKQNWPEWRQFEITIKSSGGAAPEMPKSLAVKK